VKPTLLVLGVFPPPASGTEVFALLNGTCTGLTAYTGEAFVVQPVVGDAVNADIVSDVFFRPMYEWIDFEEVIGLIPFHGADVRAGDGLLLSQSANPNMEGLQSP
jgi:hypothetical protein